MWSLLSAILYAIGIFALLLFGLNLFVLAIGFARHDRLIPGPVPDPDAVPEPDGTWPAVTVQLPLYNEALVAARLIDACADLQYPVDRFEIQVLDDSTDTTTGIVQERVAHWQRRGVAISHIRRDRRDGYKAGALQHGLASTRSDLIAIFDADFIPASDFLLRMVPSFDDPEVGMVQARWAHQNEDHSLLTKLQAFGLDAHFAVEQHVRNALGLFINFNGTAGIWRRACIDDAGGWRADTLTEDLDLSYRAQLRGWRFVYRPDVAVPAELPEHINAFRTQQFRWTKGAAQTALLTLPRLWQSDEPLSVKAEGTFHLTAHAAYPFVLLVALLHAPLLWLKAAGNGPGEAYFATLGVGMLGFAGFFLSQLFAQRDLYHDWPRRMLRFPVFMAATMGMSISNVRAISQAVAGRRTPFVRTPKGSVDGGTSGAADYRDRRIPAVAWVELAFAVYSALGLILAVSLGEWAAVPFQLLFVAGFGLVSVLSLNNE